MVATSLKKKTKKDEKIYDRTCTKFKCLPT